MDAEDHSGMNGAAPEGPVEEEEIPVTAPTMPWSIKFARPSVYFQKRSGDGIGLVIVPTIPGPNGPPIPLAPAVEVEFDAFGWEGFQKVVADGGIVPPKIQTATILPGSPKIH